MALLNGRRALVTGSSAGLGFGIAQELAVRGAQVLMCSRSPERIQAAADRIAAHMKQSELVPGVAGRHIPHAIATDVTDPGAADKLAAAAQKELGGLDVLVCSAAGPPAGDFADMDDHAWEEAFRLILLTPIRLIRACLPMLRASGSGRIILISSISGIQPVAQLILSNTLRPGLMGLARHLGGELAKDGILINAIAPGFCDTERAREVEAAIAASSGRTFEEVRAQHEAQIPLARLGQPAELGRYIAFLVSEENTYITGQTLVIDGGLSTAP
jgi:3-oxoacyl-[acyl-carrier protein] reductase